MAAGYVTSVEDALARAADGSAVTIGAEAGSTILEQRAEWLAPGATTRRLVEGRHELLFVTGGYGTVRLAGQEHELTPETAVFAAAGDALELESSGPGPLELVTVRTPAEHTPRPGRHPIVRYGDQPARPAGIGREFRLLVCDETDCRDVTQFVGVVPPGRAAMHNHAYDEVAYIVEGEGMLHWEDGTSVPLRRGSCIHFPRYVLHSLENVGAAPLRVMGVFHPAGSPAAREYEAEE